MISFRRIDHRWATVLTLLVVVIATFGSASGAAAHSSLESTTPTAGETVSGPLDTLAVEFTKPVTLVGAGFDVLLPDGRIETLSAESNDDLRWTLRPSDAIADGLVAVRYEVASQDDGHILAGGFSFTVAKQNPATNVSAEQEERAAAFLADVTDDGAAAAGEIGRRVQFVAILISAGLVTLVLGAVATESAEAGALSMVVAFLGSALLLGSGIELYGLLRAVDTGLPSASTSPPLTPPLLRVLASALIMPLAWTADGPDRQANVRLRKPLQTLAVLGLAIGVLSFGFDGHTVSAGPRVLHALSNAVHVAAAGVWVGGLVGLSMLMGRRVRGRNRSGAVELFIGFSSLAAVALIAVLLAGLVMALLIIDAPSDLTSTPWGRRFLIKMAAVAVGICIGGYNRFALLPRLRANPASATLIERARLALAAEAIVLVVAAAVAAAMVAATPT